jgi:hypothetical protein
LWTSPLTLDFSATVPQDGVTYTQREISHYSSPELMWGGNNRIIYPAENTYAREPPISFDLILLNLKNIIGNEATRNTSSKTSLELCVASKSCRSGYERRLFVHDPEDDLLDDTIELLGKDFEEIHETVPGMEELQIVN